MAATAQVMHPGLFDRYDPGSFYDEMFSAPGAPRAHYKLLFQKLGSMGLRQFEERRKLADLSFLLQGITFTVYSDGRGTERLFPFDLIPRILPHSEWERIERGLSSACRGAESVPARRLRQAVHSERPPDSRARWSIRASISAAK